jgi:hypothetical protein
MTDKDTYIEQSTKPKFKPIERKLKPKLTSTTKITTKKVYKYIKRLEENYHPNVVAQLTKIIEAEVKEDYKKKYRQMKRESKDDEAAQYLERKKDEYLKSFFNGFCGFVTDNQIMRDLLSPNCVYTRTTTERRAIQKTHNYMLANDEAYAKRHNNVKYHNQSMHWRDLRHHHLPTYDDTFYFDDKTIRRMNNMKGIDDKFNEFETQSMCCISPTTNLSITHHTTGYRRHKNKVYKRLLRKFYCRNLKQMKVRNC